MLYILRCAQFDKLVIFWILPPFLPFGNNPLTCLEGFSYIVTYTVKVIVHENQCVQKHVIFLKLYVPKG